MAPNHAVNRAPVRGFLLGRICGGAPVSLDS